MPGLPPDAYKESIAFWVIYTCPAPTTPIPCLADELAPIVVLVYVSFSETKRGVILFKPLALGGALIPPSHLLDDDEAVARVFIAVIDAMVKLICCGCPSPHP